MSGRVVERVRRDFSDPGVAAVVIDLLEEWGDARPGWEVHRVQAAIVLRAAGDVDEVLALLEVAHDDYRDALMATGFANADWRECMEGAFGTW